MSADQPPFPSAILIAGLAAVLAAGLFGLYGAFAIAIGACGGDGGSTYAEAGSPRDHLCETAESQLQLIEFPGVPLVVLVSTVLACARRRFTPLLLGIGLATLTFIGPLGVLSSAAGDCQERYYESTECARYG